MGKAFDGKVPRLNTISLVSFSRCASLSISAIFCWVFKQIWSLFYGDYSRCELSRSVGIIWTTVESRNSYYDECHSIALISLAVKAIVTYLWKKATRRVAIIMIKRMTQPATSGDDATPRTPGSKTFHRDSKIVPTTTSSEATKSWGKDHLKDGRGW